MKRPAFQFYPDRWRGNAKLRRCSWAARGAWSDTLCMFHESEHEYGVLRWPLIEISNAIGAPLKLLLELVDKGVMKGGDHDVAAYIYVPRHGGKEGTPVTLIDANPGPCWYSSRMVRDEYLRSNRGAATRFGGSGGDSGPSLPEPSQRQGGNPTAHPSANPPSGKVPGSNGCQPSPTRRQGAGALSLSLGTTKSKAFDGGVGSLVAAVDNFKVNGGINPTGQGQEQSSTPWNATREGIDAKCDELGLPHPTEVPDVELIRSVNVAMAKRAQA